MIQLYPGNAGGICVSGSGVGWGCEHPGCAQLPTEAASGIRDVSAALLRHLLFATELGFVYTLTKIPFPEHPDSGFVAKGILLEVSLKLIYFHFQYIPSEMDKCPCHKSHYCLLIDMCTELLRASGMW